MAKEVGAYAGETSQERIDKGERLQEVQITGGDKDMNLYLELVNHQHQF